MPGPVARLQSFRLSGARALPINANGLSAAALPLSALVPLKALRATVRADEEDGDARGRRLHVQQPPHSLTDNAYGLPSDLLRKALVASITIGAIYELLQRSLPKNLGLNVVHAEIRDVGKARILTTATVPPHRGQA